MTEFEQNKWYKYKKADSLIYNISYNIIFFLTQQTRGLKDHHSQVPYEALIGYIEQNPLQAYKVSLSYGQNLLLT